jgi:hypothetical protein
VIAGIIQKPHPFEDGAFYVLGSYMFCDLLRPPSLMSCRPSSTPLRSPFSRRRSLLVSANDVGIDHDVSVLPVLQEIGKDPVHPPVAVRCVKALVGRLVCAIVLRHVLPSQARAQNSQGSVHKPPVILCRSASRSDSPWKQNLDPTPLHRQLIRYTLDCAISIALV